MTFGTSSSRSIAAMVVAVTVLAAGIRFFRLDNQSFWTDEVSSIINARVPLDKIVETSATLNNCPPTYFLALRPIVGTSNDHIEFRGRLLSAVAGLFSIPLFIGVVWLWRKRWDTALVAGLALAINPLHLWYSQEVRAYALMLLLGLAGLFAFELAITGRRAIWWGAYAAFALAAMATHKTGLSFPLFCLLRQGLEFARRRQNSLAFLLHGIVILAGGVLLNLNSHPPTKEYGRPSSILEIGYTGMTFLGGYSFGPSLTEIQSLGPAAAVSRHLTQVGILGVVLAIFAVMYLSELRRLLLSKETGLLLLGIGIVVAGSIVSRFPYNVRYALPALFGFLALVALLATPPAPQRSREIGERFDERPESQLEKPKLSSRLGAVLGCGVLIVSIWSDIQWLFNSTYRKADSRAVAHWLVERKGEIQSWTVLPDYLGISVQWYLEAYPAIRSRFLAPKEPQNTSFPPVPDALIIGRRHHLPQADQIIKSYYLSASKVEEVRSFVGFEVFVRTQ